MESSSSLFFGIFGAFVVSASTMVLIPHSQIGKLAPQVQWDENAPSPADVYPVDLTLTGHLPGQAVYMSEGCYYCHTQQVRDPQYGPDAERGWGPRRTVARDYIYEDAPLLGSTRIGPDLANYGWATEDAGKIQRHWRNEPVSDPKKPAERDAKWIFQHLHSPKTYVSDSLCPPRPGLFQRHEIGAQPSPNAVAVDGKYELIPTQEAVHLAEYLLRLNRTHELKEAPALIKPAKEAKK